MANSQSGVDRPRRPGQAARQSCGVVSQTNEAVRTNGDRDAGVTENVQSGLGNEASAEHKHFAIERGAGYELASIQFTSMAVFAPPRRT